MDVKDYISSDILDRYVLGAVSDQERKEVECMSHIYPEIKTAVDDLQQSVNKYVSSYEKTPPATLKAKVMAELEKLSQADKAQAKVIPLQETSTEKASSSKTYKWLAAASVILFILTAFLYSDIRSKLTSSQNETLALADQLQPGNDLHPEIYHLASVLCGEWRLRA